MATFVASALSPGAALTPGAMLPLPAVPSFFSPDRLDIAANECLSLDLAAMQQVSDEAVRQQCSYGAGLAAAPVWATTMASPLMASPLPLMASSLMPSPLMPSPLPLMPSALPLMPSPPMASPLPLMASPLMASPAAAAHFGAAVVRAAAHFDA